MTFTALSRGGRTLINSFLKPKGIAVVGATLEPYHGGRHLVENLTRGFQGCLKT